MIINILKRREESDTYLTQVCRHRWSKAFISCKLVSLLLQLMEATLLAESSYSIYFHRDLSAPAMSTDMSKVGVALFPSF